MTKPAKFRLALALLALAGVAATIQLGNWQSGRAREKAQQQARLEEALAAAPVPIDPDVRNVAGLAHRPVEVSGVFIEDRTILLDNRLRDGAAGYEVVTPLAISAKTAILVNRGWTRAALDRNILPVISTPAGTVTLSGIAQPVEARYVELSEHTVSGRVWQNLNFDLYKARSGLDLLPLVIQQRSPLADGLDRRWPRPDARVDTHRAYALQWYTMAGAILIFYAVFHVRSRRARSQAQA